MEQQLLRNIATEYLVPLFSGAQLRDNAQKSTPRESLAAFIDPLSISFKVDKKDDYRLILTRPQPFSKSTEAVVPELEVVEAFVAIVSSMSNQLKSHLKDDLLSTFQRRVVARAIGSSKQEKQVLSGIDQLASWGTRLYEGAPIAASVGFRNPKRKTIKSVQLRDIAANDFGAVLSNGYDTLLEFDLSERFITNRVLEFPASLPSFCPVRQTAVAEWTTKNQNRIALSLNRLGEILVIRNEQLLFTRRSGQWHFLTHEPVLSQMGIPRNRDIRRAIYETCLDASFARTGACVGVVSQSYSRKWKEFVDESDRLENGSSVKARAIQKMIGRKKFQGLDRRLRQELVAIDGATVITHQGDILAVGAILKIPGGSTGGGRLAAAKTVSGLGLGIKVSQDGGITGFRGGKDGPAFRVM